MVLEQRRLAFHNFLHELYDGKCYYSPPTGMEMRYPCIVYEIANPSMVHADNIPYLVQLQWTVTVIDEDPDSQLASLFFNLPKCRFDRKYESENLNHFVFSLYF